MPTRTVALASALFFLLAGFSLLELASQPAAASVSGSITLGANSDIQTVTLPFTFGTNSVYTVTCGLQLSGGDFIQHVWWRIRITTPGLSPGYVISADEEYNWLESGYVWTSATPTFTSQTGTAYLQIDNADSASQTFNYVCNSAYLTSVMSYSSLASASGSVTVQGKTSATLYTSQTLPANALVTAQVGITVDPSGTGTEIHTFTRVLMSKQPSWYIAGVDRAQQFWEISPSAGRLPVDLNVIGLNGYQLLVTIYNADSGSHDVYWSVDNIWQSSTKTIAVTGTSSGTVFLNPGASQLVAEISTPDNTKVYLVVPGVSLNGYGDEAQGVHWAAYDYSFSDFTTHAAGTESVYHWWLISAVHFRSYPWRDTNTKIEFTIENDDTAGQSFYYNLAVYQFTA